jgi:hypothetical protein
MPETPTLSLSGYYYGFNNAREYIAKTLTEEDRRTLFTISPNTLSITKVSYLNYRNEISMRYIVPIAQRYGTSNWHKDPQWLMIAYDVEKKDYREFALRDMIPIHD